MRAESWNPNAFDQMFEDVAIERLVEAAGVVADAARRKCPAGTLSRPMYRRGRYANQPWTARDAGALKKSIRVVQKLSKSGKPLARNRNVRIYGGHYLAWYARVVEYYTSYMRPALNGSLSAIKSIVGVR